MSLGLFAEVEDARRGRFHKQAIYQAFIHKRLGSVGAARSPVVDSLALRLDVYAEQRVALSIAAESRLLQSQPLKSLGGRVLYADYFA